jgi:hypothetical protein
MKGYVIATRPEFDDRHPDLLWLFEDDDFRLGKHAFVVYLGAVRIGEHVKAADRMWKVWPDWSLTEVNTGD